MGRIWALPCTNCSQFYPLTVTESDNASGKQTFHFSAEKQFVEYVNFLKWISNSVTNVQGRQMWTKQKNKVYEQEVQLGSVWRLFLASQERQTVSGQGRYTTIETIARKVQFTRAHCCCQGMYLPTEIHFTQCYQGRIVALNQTAQYVITII